jgi:hypothetical protein
MKLKSTDPDFSAAEIVNCFRALHPDFDEELLEIFFEHDQWWIRAQGPEEDFTFSVVDAAGPPNRVAGGFSFEET